MKKLIILSFALVLGLSSCDSYLDINRDPNSPSESNVDASMIFPGAEMAFAASYGNLLRIPAGYFTQHYAQNFGTSNYLEYSRFNMSPSRSSRAYDHLTALCLQNLETVKRLATNDEDWGTYLAATVLRAFTLQVLIDTYGEAAYTEGLDVGNLSPKYDDGLTVYQGILAEIDAALEHGVAANSRVCTNFLFFGNSTAGEWIKLANALKLKILMRMSNVENVQSQLAALISENNFPTEDVAWDGIWSNESGQANPFFQEEFASYFGATQVNVVGNLALIGTMQATNDNRLSAFYNPNNSGNFTGSVSGSNFSTSSSYRSDYWCRPAATYDMPVYLVSLSEIEFFLAEYYARYGTSAQAEEHYKAAIDASFASTGVAGAADVYNTHYPWDNNRYAELIGVQKWIALANMNTVEAWCEMRRLKYPAFGTVTGAQIYNVGTDTFQPDLYVPGTLYTPISYSTNVGANTMLQRFPYPENAINRNSSLEQQPATISARPVFWAQ